MRNLVRCLLTGSLVRLVRSLLMVVRGLLMGSFLMGSLTSYLVEMGTPVRDSLMGMSLGDSFVMDDTGTVHLVMVEMVRDAVQALMLEEDAV